MACADADRGERHESWGSRMNRVRLEEIKGIHDELERTHRAVLSLPRNSRRAQLALADQLEAMARCCKAMPETRRACVGPSRVWLSTREVFQALIISPRNITLPFNLPMVPSRPLQNSPFRPRRSRSTRATPSTSHGCGVPVPTALTLVFTGIQPPFFATNLWASTGSSPILSLADPETSSPCTKRTNPRVADRPSPVSLFC